MRIHQLNKVRKLYRSVNTTPHNDTARLVIARRLLFSTFLSFMPEIDMIYIPKVNKQSSVLQSIVLLKMIIFEA